MSWPAGARILIVDDNPGDVMLAEQALRASGVRFVVAHCADLAGAEALHGSEPFDAILLDLHLPESSGGDTIRRARGFAPDTPIVALTGAGEEESLGVALEADADDFVPKDQLSGSTIARALRHAKQRRRLTATLQVQRAALERSEGRLRAVLSTVSDGIIVVDETGRILFRNESADRLPGIGEDRVDDDLLHALSDPETQILPLPCPEKGPDRTVEVEVQSAGIDWEGSKARVGSLRDVSDRLRMESRMRALQRIEAVGQLAGGMAHEMNNMLAVILANVGLLVEEEDAEERAMLIEDVQVAARRGAGLVRTLLAYARRRRLRVSTLDLASVVFERLEMVARAHPVDLALEVLVPDAPALVRVDPDAIEQVLLALIINAHEATPRGGERITVEVDQVELLDGQPAPHPEMPPGSYIRLSVTDAGVGMSAETVDKAFEPFFSTKDDAEGVGLGLATVYGLTKQQGGFIFIDSEVGRGTRVDLYFTVADGAAEDGAGGRSGEGVVAATASEGRAASPTTILLAEDEEGVRRTTARVLRRFGCVVHEAEDGVEALEVLKERSAEIDLILSDVVMPRLGGRELYEAVSQLSDPPSFLFVSGYAADDLRRGELLHPSMPVLKKPWSAPELMEAVEVTLAESPNGGRKRWPDGKP